MNKPAAFRATYSDLKLIKTRQCVQVIFELPLADFDAAYVILGGMPNPASETWFGIAPLKSPQAEKENEAPSPKSSPQPTHPPAAAKREKMDWRDVQPAAQAGIRCADPVFIAFLKEQYEHYWINNHDDVARTVRDICSIQSRTELNTDHSCRMIWKALDSQFQAWKARENA